MYAVVIIHLHTVAVCLCRIVFLYDVVVEFVWICVPRFSRAMSLVVCGGVLVSRNARDSLHKTYTTLYTVPMQQTTAHIDRQRVRVFRPAPFAKLG